MSTIATPPRPDAVPLRDPSEPAAPAPAGPSGRAAPPLPSAPPAVPDLSVIVVNRNTRELLAECLAAGRAFAGPVSVEVIVVDNGSTDGSAQRVREK
ncbi:MAG TPA: glycosyltransferase, partial [Longimicrobiaceae bacterium]|nr:glycosyltransferase [Longimicrobiaceae bacterium]